MSNFDSANYSSNETAVSKLTGFLDRRFDYADTQQTNEAIFYLDNPQEMPEGVVIAREISQNPFTLLSCERILLQDSVEIADTENEISSKLKQQRDQSEYRVHIMRSIYVNTETDNVDEYEVTFQGDEVRYKLGRASTYFVYLEHSQADDEFYEVSEELGVDKKEIKPALSELSFDPLELEFLRLIKELHSKQLEAMSEQLELNNITSIDEKGKRDKSDKLANYLLGKMLKMSTGAFKYKGNMGA